MKETLIKIHNIIKIPIYAATYATALIFSIYLYSKLSDNKLAMALISIVIIYWAIVGFYLMIKGLYKRSE